MDSNDRFVFHRIDSRDGVTLAVREWGDRDAPPVLFLHGGGQTGWAWEASARRLARSGFRGMALDFRGHGDSGWADASAYELDDFACDVMAVVEQLCDRAPVVVGASLGGASAMVAAGEIAPGEFSALALVDMTPRWEPRGVERILNFLAAHPDGFDDLESAAQAVGEYLPHRKGRTSPEGLRKNLRQGADGRWQWHWDPSLLEGADSARSRWQERLTRAAQGLDVPTLLVSGGLSDVVSEATIEDFMQLVPHAEHVCIDDAHHMVAGDRNDHFTHAIMRFLGVRPEPLTQETS